MKINPFTLERYFAKYEFSTPYLLSCSDAEPLTLNEVLAMADEETKALWHNLCLGYTDSQGHPLLLKEIANLYEGITHDSVVEVIPEEGIFISMNVLLDPDDHVITTFPGYQSLYEIAVSIGCHISRWMPNPHKSNAFSVQDLKRLIRKNTKLIVINFPHNPTGALPKRSELEAIIQLADNSGICVFSDEMYRFSEQNQNDRLPSICELYPKGISLSGLSKSFSLPGLRVGWLVSTNISLLEKIKTFKDYTSICGSSPSEILAIIALRAKNAIINRNQAIIKRNLEIIDLFFEKHTNIFSWQRPIAGTICFPTLLLDVPVEKFCDMLMEKKGVMMLPASVIGYPGNNFRLGFGRKNMPEALEKLEDFLNEMGFC